MRFGTRILVALAVSAFALSTVDASAKERPGRGNRGGVRPSFSTLLRAFDADGSSSLEEDEVPPRVWMRLSQADADGDGSITEDEFDSYRPKAK